LGSLYASGQYNLSEDIYGNEAKIDYCYNFLRNSESKSFLVVPNQLNFNFEH